ncbi:hypothetical protein [Streptomyces pseudovenezuelae]|uniref:TetR family transcriptional regulator n=1 Tax=Streptomyces pseudovenezuelae TaxID=67350 RepID=A0ABT6LZY9_9ACTN|nr:hypothetical protein [Streptomyces pseudovenezuelae]MDH6221870.1 hypothetical protein [Streptomyces pseudovenezuelae]
MFALHRIALIVEGWFQPVAPQQIREGYNVMITIFHGLAND